MTVGESGRTKHLNRAEAILTNFYKPELFPEKVYSKRVASLA